MLAWECVIRVLDSTEHQRDVLALTDSVVNPSGVLNPIAHNTNHNVGRLEVVHGQKEFAYGGGVLLVKAAHGLAVGIGLVRHRAQR